MAGAALAAPAAQACDRVAAAQSDSQRLRALMAESDAAFLDRNPRAAFYRGDFSDAGSLGSSALLDEFDEDTVHAMLAEVQAAKVSECGGGGVGEGGASFAAAAGAGPAPAPGAAPSSVKQAWGAATKEQRKLAKQKMRAVKEQQRV